MCFNFYKEHFELVFLRQKKQEQEKEESLYAKVG